MRSGHIRLVLTLVACLAPAAIAQGDSDQGLVGFSADEDTSPTSTQTGGYLLPPKWEACVHALGGGETSLCGRGGGEEHGNDHVDFRIDIDPDGSVCVNGEELAVCDPADGCHLALAWSGSANTLVVQVVAADGTLVAAQYYLEQAPDELHVEAAEIRYLSLVAQ